MSLPWAALLKRLSIRLQPHGPSHLIRSQWKPVAPCHHSYGTGKRRCNGEDSHWSRELDTLRKPFRCKERILCDSCTTPSHMGGAALGWRGEIVRRQREREREGDTHKERRRYFHSSWVYIQNPQKPHPRFYQSNCPPIYLNYTWMRMKTITALQNSKAFCLLVSLSLSFISLHWYLHVNDVCVSAFLSLSLCLFFLWSSYLHVSGFRFLMVPRCNESNLLCDSQTILPAITLIHSGQWILMTMKPRSCEDIFARPPC